MLFQYDLGRNDPESIPSGFEDLQRAAPAVQEFAIGIFRGTIEHLDELDEMITRQAENWRMTRMSAVDRNIMRMSIYELLYEPETPYLVVINEAIEIAKRFGTDKSSQFINGILDGILKRYNLVRTPRS